MPDLLRARGKRHIPASSPRSAPFRPGIRSTPRAFILADEKLLVQKKQHPAKGLYYTLPGGKQEPGETLAETLKRECLEEVGAQIEVGALLHVAEIFRQKDDPGEQQHQLDFVFACSVPSDYEPVLGPHPDPHQIATCWITAEDAAQLRPAYVTTLFCSGCRRGGEVYLGTHDD